MDSPQLESLRDVLTTGISASASATSTLSRNLKTLSDAEKSGHAAMIGTKSSNLMLLHSLAVIGYGYMLTRLPGTSPDTSLLAKNSQPALDNFVSNVFNSQGSTSLDREVSILKILFLFSRMEASMSESLDEAIRDLDIPPSSPDEPSFSEDDELGNFLSSLIDKAGANVDIYKHLRSLRTSSPSITLPFNHFVTLFIAACLGDMAVVDYATNSPLFSSIVRSDARQLLEQFKFNLSTENEANVRSIAEHLSRRSDCNEAILAALPPVP